MIIYTNLFYILFILIFQNYLKNEFFIYIVLFIISLIMGYFFSKKFGDLEAKLKEYFETEYKHIHDFFDMYFIAIIIIAPIILGFLYNLLS